MFLDREGREHVGERYCGNWNNMLPPPLRGMQSKLQIFFTSSYESGKHRGFKIWFEFVFEGLNFFSIKIKKIFSNNRRTSKYLQRSKHAI